MLPRALVLDYGEVLSYPQRPGAMAALAALLQADTDEMSAAYWRHREEYDLGLPAPEYWRRVAADLGRTGASDGVLDRLIDVDVESWTHYRDEMWALARQFRSRGGRLAMLSNGVPEIVAKIRLDHDLQADFDTVVISFEVSLAKPDRRIYLLTLERLGVEAGEALFVDDRAVNIDAAAAVGMDALLFDGAPAMRDLARRLDAMGSDPVTKFSGV